MKFVAFPLMMAVGLAVSPLAQALEPMFYTPFLDETDKVSEWALTCNNINTCYADGYHVDDYEDEHLASLLLKRTADHQLTAKVNVANYDDETPVSQLFMRVAGRNMGQLTKDGERFRLSATQISAITDSVAKTGTAQIEFYHGKDVYKVSDEGLKEVLIKMDEHQGVAQTPLALIHKGNKTPTTKTAPMPKITPKPTLTQEATYISIDSPAGKKLINFLKANATEDVAGCDILADDAKEFLSDGQMSFRVEQITKDKKLVTGRCYSAAYNFGDAAWVMNNELTHIYQTIENISDRYDNELTYSYKGRGIGDCWGGSVWVWTGSEYAVSEEFHTGQCKGFAGGAWNIPSYITDVAGKKTSLVYD